MIDLVLVKRDILRYVQDVRVLRRMGHGLSTTILYCVKSGKVWIKRREVMVGAKRIRSEKLREHQYRK